MSKQHSLNTSFPLLTKQKYILYGIHGPGVGLSKASVGSRPVGSRPWYARRRVEKLCRAECPNSFGGKKLYRGEGITMGWVNFFSGKKSR